MSLVREFLSDLRDLIAAGFPVIEALEQMRQASGGPRSDLAARMAAKIREGGTLSEAMRLAPRVFGWGTATLVHVGEATGKLDEVLSSLVRSLERRADMRARVLKKAAYPILLLTAAVVLLPLPRIVDPGPGSYVELELKIFGAVAIAAGLAHLAWRSLRTNRAQRERALNAASRLPLLGRWLGEASIGKCYTLLGLSIEAGMPISQALELSAGSSSWTRLGGELRAVETRLREGLSLGNALASTELLGARRGDISRLVVAEKSGRLEQALRDLGDEIEERTLARIERCLKLAAASVIPVVAIFVIIRLQEVLGRWTAPPPL